MAVGTLIDMDTQHSSTQRTKGDDDDKEATHSSVVMASSDPIISAVNSQSLLAENDERTAQATDLRTRSSSLGSQNKRKRRRRKANDKPKRPLSAYNIFFQLERQKLLEEVEKNADLGSAADKANNKSKLGFANLARYIAAKWKNIDDGTLAYYQNLADKEQRRYMNELVKWKIQEAHDLFDGDEAKGKPWSSREPYQVDELGTAMPHAATGWNVASSTFHQDDGDRRFVSGDSTDATTAAVGTGATHQGLTDPITSDVPSATGYMTDGYYAVSPLATAATYEHAALFGGNSGHEKGDWLNHTADGVDTRWSRLLENEMEESVKELSKMVTVADGSNAPYYIHELEPLPVGVMASLSSSGSMLESHQHQQQQHHAIPAPLPHLHQAHTDYSEQKLTPLPLLQRLSFHLDEDEQEFLIARLAADTTNPPL